MAYLKGYTYDIFISYAHLDNEKVFGQTIGWIEQFYTDLNILLARRVGKAGAIKIWWDSKKLDGSILFDQSIAEGIKQSAIMLCLTSPGYSASEYCKKELDLFYKKGQQESLGLHVGGRSRIINVLLNNIPFSEWPEELTGTTGFHFHTEQDNEDLGDPLDVGSPQFKIQLQFLRDAIIKLMNSFPREETVQQPDLKEEKKEENRFTIYFGDVADSLRHTRKRTIAELEKKEFRIIYDVPPPFDADTHEQVVKEKLQEASMAVHLLDQFPGREIEGDESIWFPQKQAELSLQFSKSQLIWVPAEMDIEEVEEEQYKLFIKDLESGKKTTRATEYIRGAKSTLTQQIVDMAEQIKNQQKQPVDKRKISVLLDTHYNDQIYALEVSKSLLENHIQPFINPQEDDPRKNINILDDRISQVNKLVFLYGNVSRDWVLERMSAALQLIVTHNYPVEEFFVFMVPPHKKPDDISLKQKFLKIEVINNSNTSVLNTEFFISFIKN